MTDALHDRLAAGCETHFVEANGVTLRVVSRGKGPLVLFVPGFPEIWSSWRHQLAPVAQAGFRAEAIDVRGYGGSSKPQAREAYGLVHMAGDVAALIDLHGGGEAILIGHDWGAAIVYTAALLYPRKVRALAGMAGQYRKYHPAPPKSLMDSHFKDSFFYQHYFQTEGTGEAEFQRDIRTGLRKFYYSLSAAGADAPFRFIKPKGSDLLSDVAAPTAMPAWFTKDDEDYCVANFTASGFRGPINRYRCVDDDWHALRAYADKPLEQPSLFIGGAKDPVRWMDPRADAFESAGDLLADCRGVHVIDGAGHWVQQEQPEAVNRCLLKFLNEVR